MRILHIASIGHHAEGIGTVLKKLVPLQINLGYDVKIISLRINKTYPDLPITTIRNNTEFKIFIDKWTPEIVQFHSVYHMEYIRFVNVLNSCNVPYLVQMHGALSEENYNKNHWKKWLANLIWYNNFLKKAKAIIYLSKAEYDKCIVKKIQPRSLFFPNGCEQPKDINFNRFNKNNIDIVFIGRISYIHKGLDILIDAIKLLKNKGKTNFHITFYGNEDDVHVSWLKEQLCEVRELASYGGGIYGNEKDLRLRHCNMFILTSRYEGMPMGVLEAFSYGVPCIVTPGTNMEEIILSKKAGWVCNPIAEDIASTIQTAIYTYSENPTLYHQNAKKASLDFNWVNIAKKTIQSYQTILYEL